MRINLEELAPGQMMTISHQATPADTVKAIDQVSTFAAQSPEVKRLASDYKGNLPGLFSYVHSRIAYENDPPDHQKVRTPARSLKDGRGNCVDYTTIISSVLKAQGLPHRYRVVKYQPGGWQHIYPVAGNVPLDPVINQRQDGTEGLNGQRSKAVYGKELPYLAKWDYMPKLSILGQTGSTEQVESILRNAKGCLSVYSNVGGDVRKAAKLMASIPYTSADLLRVDPLFINACNKITGCIGDGVNRQRNCRNYWLDQRATLSTALAQHSGAPATTNGKRSYLSPPTSPPGGPTPGAPNQLSASWLLPVALIGGLFLLTTKKKRR